MKDIINNFKDKFNCSSDEKLATFLGTTRGMITNAKLTDNKTAYLGKSMHNSLLLIQTLLKRIKTADIALVMTEFNEIKR